MTMAHDQHRTKQLLGRTMSRTEAGTVVVPLGGSKGTTNAIIFGVLLAAFRDLDLNYVTNKPFPRWSTTTTTPPHGGTITQEFPLCRRICRQGASRSDAIHDDS